MTRTTETHRTTTEIAQLRSQIVGIDVKVPVLDGSLRPYINFDNAASTPALRPVLDSVIAFLDWYSSVHRGAGFKSRIATEAYERAHERVASFVGADPDKNVVIFGKNTTEAINKLARRIPFSDDSIVISTHLEHHSNDLPWRLQTRVEHVQVSDDGQLEIDDLRRKLADYRGRVSLVAVSGASNVTGCLTPIHEIARLAHEAGAPLLVDAAQLAAHRPIDMKPDDHPHHIDFLALSGHKMYAPFGTGALVGPRSLFEQGDPDYVGGGTVSIVSPDEVHWSGLPDREEAGSPNVVGAVALAKAIEVLEELGLEAVAEHERGLTSYALDRMADIEGFTLYGPSAVDRDRLGVICFTLGDLPHALVSAVLSCEYAIGTRNGCFCAHPYVKRLLHLAPDEIHQVTANILRGDRSAIPGMVRASFGIYNRIEEIDTLISALRDIVHGRNRGDYILDQATGEYWPKGFDPDLSDYFSL
jgi:cysteine desulfurase/selenocysteine lyase